jgi:asparagine synthase (glutamine-hydrolysing)
MCGICGFVSRERLHGESELRAIVTRMARTLHHRGPDGSGVWTDIKAGLALGHARLSILDLSDAGAQPMVSESGRYVITYNGEVYNFPELRQDLESQGHKFRGHSDTEIVLAALAEWGIEPALQRMNGMFAFGVWDRETRSLTLARDRAGKKPLYYGWCGDVFLFGSELKALRTHQNFDHEIDRDALGLLVKYSRIPAPYCIYKKIRKLPAGSFLTLTAHGSSTTSAPVAYWSAQHVAERGEREPFSGTSEEAVEALDSLLRGAVSRRMVADVDLGALLSGGVDSSTIVSLMQSTSTVRVKTFSIGFHEPKYNEAEHAKAIARHLGTDHTELYVTPNESLDVIPDLPIIYDEPFADPSQIPTYLVSRLARGAVKVALSGDGGDELFAGYKQYRQCQTYWEDMKRFPVWLRQDAATAISALSRLSWHLLGARQSAGPRQGTSLKRIGTKLEKIAKRLAAGSPQDFLTRHHSQCQNATEFVVGAVPVPTVLTDPSRWANVSDPIQAMLYLDFVDYMADDILVKVDRASMAVGLEVRCPLLDRDVIEFAWSLPAGMRFDPGGGKRILRSVLSRYVPRELTERPKMGFGVPVDAWIRGPLREWAEALLDERRIREQGFLRPEPVRRIWQQHVTGFQNHQYLLWNLLMFQAWNDATALGRHSISEQVDDTVSSGQYTPRIVR